MVFQKVIEHISDKLFGLNLFERVYELAELMENSEGKKLPHEYISKGTYKPISVTSFNGVSYIRKNGNIKNSDVSDESIVACANLMRIEIPLRVLAYKKKSELPIDCKFSDDWLAERMIPVLTSKSGTLKQAIGAMKVSIDFESYNTDSKEVLSQETNFDEQADVNSKLACVSIDVNVSITIERNCFNTLCDEY